MRMSLLSTTSILYRSTSSSIEPFLSISLPSTFFSVYPFVYPSHRIQKLLFGKYTFLNKQPGEGFLLDYVGHQEFFKGNDLFGVKGGMTSRSNHFFQTILERTVLLYFSLQLSFSVPHYIFAGLR